MVCLKVPLFRSQGGRNDLATDGCAALTRCNACADADNGVDSSHGRDAGGWIPRPVRGGHSGPVVDMCWAADGACVLSVSADQTARTFTSCQGSWCEIARPEVRDGVLLPLLHNNASVVAH